MRVFGRGQVSTYFILGLGESAESVMEGCRAAIGRGVYPFVVPLRPSPGSIVAHGRPPSVEYMREVYEMVAPLLADAKMLSQDARAGCVRFRVPDDFFFTLPALPGTGKWTGIWPEKAGVRYT